MRTDKEQLDIIIERKCAFEKRNRRNKKIGISVLSLVLCFTVAIGCAFAFGGKNEKGLTDGFTADSTNGDKSYSSTSTNSVPNKDGVIGGSPDKAEGGVGRVEDAVMEGIPTDDKEGGIDVEYGGIGGYVPDGGSDVYQPYQPSSGTLTGGELVDNELFTEWLDVMNEKSWKSLQDKWGLYTEKRVSVKGTPFSQVRLLDSNGNAVKGAVTNYKGEAFMFLSVQESYQSVELISNKQVYKLDSNADHSYTFEVPADTKYTHTNLDLMFVIDTTGSMSDELEYLKAEISNVITRINEKDISVRTSVNFYRDEGDQYVVKYHAFKDGAAEVQSVIAAEHADGGGDFPEAVHTALDNAVNDHAWAEDSVKLMFLVLDAPPHADSEVIESLSSAVEKASEMGIRIIPVASSGIDAETEFILRSIALNTNGSYTFLTNHSGIGNPHIDPSTSADYEIEMLNDMLVRIALQQCGIETEKKPISDKEQQ